MGTYDCSNGVLSAGAQSRAGAGTELVGTVGASNPYTVHADVTDNTKLFHQIRLYTRALSASPAFRTTAETGNVVAALRITETGAANLANLAVGYNSGTS